MARVVKLVATPDIVKRMNPEGYANFIQRNHREPNLIISADFQVNPELCQSKFGKWLAERVFTTRFDDDLSLLAVTRRTTQMDRCLAELAQRIESSHCSSVQHFSSVKLQVEQWLDKKSREVEVYGDTFFEPIIEHFKWPVFGSAKAGGETSVEAYFDNCAKMIRGMTPAEVKFAVTRESPPESLGVCKR